MEISLKYPEMFGSSGSQPLSIQSPHSGNTMAELVALIYGERKRHVKQQHLGDESLYADSQS